MPASSRAPLACIPCRNAKSKCDGTVPSAIASSFSQSCSSISADWPCSRCQRLQRDCHWKAAHRTGRPRLNPTESKIQKTSTTTTATDSMMGLSSPFDHQSTNTSFNSSPPPTDPDLYGFVENFLNDESFNIFSFPSDSVNDASMVTSSNSPLVDPLPSSITSSPTTSHDFASSMMNQDMVGFSAPEMKVTTPHHTLTRQQSSETNLPLGLQRYFKSIGQTSPLLGLQVDFMRRYHSCQPILLDSMSALGHLFFEGNESRLYQEARQRSLVAAFSLNSDFNLEGVKEESNSTAGNAQKVLDVITSLIFLTYLEFGHGDEDQASRCLTMASSIALRCGLNTLKLDEDDINSTIRDDESHFLQIFKGESQLVDVARRVWWELFLADVVVHIATSGNVSRNLATLKVNSTGAPYIPGTNDREPYQMRIRAALLAAEIMEPGDIPLSSMDSILATSIISVQDRWLVYSKKREQSFTFDVDGKEEEKGSNTPAAMGQGLLFQTLLMLHTARLHLHRQAYFPSVTFEYKVCSFQSGNSSSLARMTEEDENACDSNRLQTSGSIQSSVEQIVQCSTSILNLMQVDSEQHFRQAQKKKLCDLPLVSPNWPFIGCCQMAASYGFALAVSVRHNSQINSNGDRGIITKGNKRNVWKEREQISNMGFAEASLGNLTQVWNVSSLYRKTVHQCRLALEQAWETDQK